MLICVLISLFLIYDHYDSKRIIEQCAANGEPLEICKRYIDKSKLIIKAEMARKLSRPFCFIRCKTD